MRGLVPGLLLVLILSGLVVAESSSTIRRDFYISEQKINDTPVVQNNSSQTGNWKGYLLLAIIVLIALVAIFVTLLKSAVAKKVRKKTKKKAGKSRKTRRKK